MKKTKAVMGVFISITVFTILFFLMFEHAKKEELEKAEYDYEIFVSSLTRMGGVYIGQDNKSVLYSKEPSAAKNRDNGDTCFIKSSMIEHGIDPSCSVWIYNNEHLESRYNHKLKEDNNLGSRTIYFGSNGRVEAINCKQGDASGFRNCRINQLDIGSYSSESKIWHEFGYTLNSEYISYNGKAGKKIIYEDLGLTFTVVQDRLMEIHKNDTIPGFYWWYDNYRPEFTAKHYLYNILGRLK